jgi:hypothetical protein
MLFLSNDFNEHKKLKAENKKKIKLVEEIIHEIFQTHAHGIFYR